MGHEGGVKAGAEVGVAEGVVAAEVELEGVSGVVGAGWGGVRVPCRWTLLGCGGGLLRPLL